MKFLIIFILMFAGYFTPIPSAKANFPFVTHDVDFIEVNRSSGGSRVFKDTDGYEEVVINKVVNWINSASSAKGTTEPENQKTPIAVLKIQMKNGDVSIIQPAYNCVSENKTKKCVLADGEVILTRNNKNIRLKSIELFDWLLVGWKYENVGASKEELLDETLYTRYFNYLDKSYDDFFMCPKIDKIERINGDGRRHVIHMSALNYSGHHAGPLHRIHITLTDTPENDVKVNNITIQKNISGKEGRIQCRREK
ncbi:hypothetical protein SAMN05444673_4369 [Bacillus sp. OV166]|uniref:hypothetical protein n=1 Tax=Bacillus sp. OV166 TaxID=1882763 RepID=UPI000A2AB307|nr:hypothetical protein [Bacillus sp. OV166]SMQ81540.1 hypothetical protein SAMN05444673_4369 [Bacillus sp. OV166]